MKQVVHKPRGGPEVEEMPLPMVQPGGVLVANRASLLSAGTERTAVSNSHRTLVGRAIEKPELVQQVLERVKQSGVKATLEAVYDRLQVLQPLGYSCAGIVQEVGPGVTEFQPGQAVACGGGGYAVHGELVFVPKNLCIHIPITRSGEGVNEHEYRSSVSFEHACFTTLGAIAMQGVRQSDCRVGEVVAVVGLGLVGLLTVQILQAAGCRVLGIDLDASRTALALDIGASRAVVGGVWDTPEDRAAILDAVHCCTEGRGVDAVLITAATQSTGPVRLAGEICRSRGRVVVVGDVRIEIPRDVYYDREIELRFSRSYGPGRYDRSYEERGLDYPIAYVRWTEKRNMEAFLELIASGKVRLQKLITHRFPIEEAEKAYDLLMGKKNEPYLGIVLTYSQRTVTPAVLRVFKGSEKPAASVSIGLIGSGSFARTVLLPALRSIDDVVFKGVAAATSTSAATTARKYRFELATCDYGQLLSRPDINCVLITTRHNLHGEMILASLRAGKPVFVEKPLCITEKELTEIIALCEEITLHEGSPPFVMVGFNRRFAPATMRARQFFEERRGPMFIQYRINAGPMPTNHWTLSQHEGGGRVLGEACHFLDFCNFMVGTQPIRVYAESATTDSVIISLKYTDGSVASIQYLDNGHAGVGKERVEIFADGRVFTINDYHSSEWISASGKGSLRTRTQDKGHQAEIVALVKSLRHGTPPPIRLRDSILTTFATFKVGESIRQAKPVDLEYSFNAFCRHASSILG